MKAQSAQNLWPHSRPIGLYMRSCAHTDMVQWRSSPRGCRSHSECSTCSPHPHKTYRHQTPSANGFSVNCPVHHTTRFALRRTSGLRPPAHSKTSRSELPMRTCRTLGYLPMERTNTLSTTAANNVHMQRVGYQETKVGPISSQTQRQKGGAPGRWGIYSPRRPPPGAQCRTRLATRSSFPAPRQARCHSARSRRSSRRRRRRRRCLAAPASRTRPRPDPRCARSALGGSRRAAPATAPAAAKQRVMRRGTVRMLTLLAGFRLAAQRLRAVAPQCSVLRTGNNVSGSHSCS